MSSDAPIATVVQGHTFTIDKRYEPKKILGRGSFGVVTTAFDSVRNTTIAIKRIRPYANDEWDARHTLREVRLMKVLGAHPNIITLFDLSLFDEKSELYMMMELMDCDLHRIIQSKQPLNDTHFKCFARQMLEAVKAMHSIGIFHRDLKPGNILVSKDCQLRITDFGLARFMDEVTLAGDNRQNPMTEYVVTRWYRCPELLLAPKEPYSTAIDLWSVGCILGELVKRKPLFPGKSHANQVQLILEVKGYRSPADLGFNLTTEAASFLDRRCKYPGQSLSSFIPQASPDAIDLLSGLLQLSPSARPTASEALAMPYLSDAQTLCDYNAPSAQLRKIDESFFDFERKEYSIEALREMIRDEVRSYQQPSPSKAMSSGGVRTGGTGYAEEKKTSKLDPPSIERQFSAGIERSSGPNSQAPTAARVRQASVPSGTHLGPSDDRIAFNKREIDEEDFGEISADLATAASKAGSSKVPLRRNGSLEANGDSSTARSSRKSPATPSPGKMQAIAKQERKQKKIFFLQSMQRKKEEGGVVSTGSSMSMGSTAPLGSVVGPLAQRRTSSVSQAPVGNNAVRAGGIGYTADSVGLENRKAKSNKSSTSGSHVPPLPVEVAAAGMPLTSDNGDLSNLFSQFQSSSFSARERRPVTEDSASVYTSSGRQLNTAPDVLSKARNSRFPSLRGGKLSHL